MTPLTHFSLFSGIGGIDLAAEIAGFRTVAVCEIDKGCRAVLSRNFPEAFQFHDIRAITPQSLCEAEVPQPTLVSAGFPCQPFSVSGLRKGTSDDRHLWPQVERVLRVVRPRWFLGENVPGLLTSRARNAIPKRLAAQARQARAETAFGAVLSGLATLGYRVGWGVFGADEACSATHRRDRVFIVGYLADSQGQRGEGVSLSGEQGPAEPHSDWQGSGVGYSSGFDQFGLSGRQGQRPEGPGPSVSGCVAHTLSLGPRGRSDGNEGRGEREVQAQGSFGLLADSRHQRSEGGKEDEFSSREEGSDWAARHSSLFPPGPGALDAWRRVALSDPRFLPALSAEAEAELSVRPVVDGISRRMALRMIGNAVVPGQVLPLLMQIAEFERRP